MLYAGIWLLSASTLLFEVALLRSFSIALWYHFSFMVVSIALLGYGLSGSFIMLAGRLRERAALLYLAPALFALSVPVCHVAANRIPFDPARLSWDTQQLLYIALYYIILSLPFFFSGLTIALALTFMAERAGRVYAADLLGAGAGPALSLALFPYLGGQGVILAASLGGFIASAFILKGSVTLIKKDTTGPRDRRGRRLVPAVGILLAASLMIVHPSFMETKVSPYKDLPFALEYSGSQTLDTQWNAFSRVDLVESPGVRFAPGLSLRYLDPLPPQRGITIDGGALTAVTNPAEPASLDFIDYLPTALPYKLLASDPKVFLADTGGGLPILEALYHGAGRITGAEKNPIVSVMANSEYSDYVYDRADIIRGEGRAVVRNSGKGYDLIMLGVGSQTAAATGFLGLTEDYRFTVDAIRDYYSALADGGYLSITRYLLPPARGELKLIATIAEALEGLEEGDPGDSLVVYRTIETFSILLKKGGLDKGELDVIREFLDKRRFDAVHYPAMVRQEANKYIRLKEPVYYDLVRGLLEPETREEKLDNYVFHIRPATDERPFFHHFFKLANVREVIESVGGKWQILLEGGYLLPLVLVQALAVSALLIALPLFRKRTRSERGARSARGAQFDAPPLVPVLTYFFSLGAAYMFVEITLIHKFILFLEHPEWAFSAVVSIMLVSSGVGSYLSRSWSPGRAIKYSITAAAAMLLILALALKPLLQLSLGETMPATKVLITVLVITPLGVVMGMPFPLGVRYLEAARGGRAFVGWAWAANGCASVLGSIVSIMAAMAVGFSGVFVAAALIYTAALAAVRKVKKSPDS